MEGFVSGFGIYLSYALFGVALISAIVLPLYKALDEPQKLVKAGIGVVALLVVFLLSWTIAGSEVTPQYITKGVEEGLSKFIGGLLTMVYILMGIAISAIIYTEATKALNLK